MNRLSTHTPKKIYANHLTNIAPKLALYWNIDLLEVRTDLGNYLYHRRRPQ